ncbi:Rv2993c-like domain-containing protein [Kribbella sp. NPDC048915]
MRYVTVEHDGRERPGVLENDTVLLLGATDLTGDLLLTGTPARVARR